jgi:lysine-N-methylase
MSFPVRQLPVIQNWSCHQCGNCCREYWVTVTEQEKRRIEGQRWADRPEFTGLELFAWYGGPPWRKEYRLTHREDGACIFLDERGLCRIHAEFGESAKPLACQLYPYMIVPAGEELRVSVRFSCPSAVRNLGRPVADQADQIRRYARELVPSGARPVEPPPVRPGQRLEWEGLLQLIAVLERLLTGAAEELPNRLVRALRFIRLIEDADLRKLKARQLREFFEIALDASTVEVPGDLGSLGDCPKWALALFRLMVAQCARKDLSPHLRRGWRGRWGLLQAAVRFARGRGPIPRLQSLFGAVDFSAVEQPLGGPPPDAARMLERYYRIKITGLQFFGRAFYRVPLVEGFYGLMLTYPVIMWIARWLARTAGRDRVGADDVAAALTVVDHQWGFSAVFGFGYARRRVLLLARQKQIERLIARYSR